MFLPTRLWRRCRLFQGSKVCPRYLQVPDLLISRSLAFFTSHGRHATLMIVAIFSIIYHYASNGNLPPPANVGPPPASNNPPLCSCPSPGSTTSPSLSEAPAWLSAAPPWLSTTPPWLSTRPPWLDAPLPQWLDTKKSCTPVAECPASGEEAPAPAVKSPTPVVN